VQQGSHNKVSSLILKVSLSLLLVSALTVVTQIGGFVFLISLFAFGYINKNVNKLWARLTVKTLSFVALYLIFTFTIVPWTAKSFGRVPLPIFEKHNLKPANIWACLLNRNYVRPQLKEITFRVAEHMNKTYPGTKVNYLDANFPFVNGFPLLPHRSHSDGKKLDLSFQYNGNATGQITSDVPSFIGYGICEEPKDGEENIPAECKQKGYWQYSLLHEVVSQYNKNEFTFDEQRTRELVNSFASHDGVAKIFIEPHLKTRLKLTNSKIRFHGCQAVRHDDHIHVEVR
jgi:hypothetical protein